MGASIFRNSIRRPVALGVYCMTVSPTFQPIKQLSPVRSVPCNPIEDRSPCSSEATARAIGSRAEAVWGGGAYGLRLGLAFHWEVRPQQVRGGQRGWRVVTQ
jgi:hypothetical protein